MQKVKCEIKNAVTSRPTAGRLGHVLANRQSIVQADG